MFFIGTTHAYLLKTSTTVKRYFRIAVNSPTEEGLPAWTGFYTLRNENSIPRECSIGYCQVIEASPTELSTVYTVLQRSLQIADQLGQHDVIIVLDQAIYAKALEVLWQNKDQFQRLVVRLGSFHTICAFLAAIGKRFGDAGLADVLMESGIVASGSVAGVIRKFKIRSLRTTNYGNTWRGPGSRLTAHAR